ncbi:hypothetical protein DOTSEDRAFT_33282 [Dothistroma septosporum NZE10]|uniref:non-specific serine/threonine protein kinase n=1 Tax=Dothistroma septosporum (strain NZE10 / CBS 128990) TaxID=675120 RepID=N1PTL6_DOTSN|nr:hypothetical protein DOTSEDRAFT_33282 [Dothistroma septosporum NZE10]
MCNYHGHSTVDERNRRWKLYLEFCPWDNLEELLTSYVRATPPASFPEEFIWYVAHECLLAAQVMAQGSTTAAIPNWRSIVHRDLKTSNIFLGPTNSARFRYYPKIKVADFGLAAETNANDPSNPIDYADGAGSHGWLAPEQQRWYRRNGNLLLDKRLTEKTQYLEDMPEQLTYDPGERVPTLGLTPSGRLYSAGLDQFILDCTEFDIGQRFDVTQALNSITTNNGFNGMHTAIPKRPFSRDTDPHKLEWLPEDRKYRLGLTRQQSPKD